MERGAGRIRVEPWSGQDGVRVERGWSKDRARAARAQWRVRRLHKLDTKNDAYFFHIVCISHRFEFATPYLFQFSTAAFSSLPLVPVPRMLGAERVEGSQKRWKKRRGLSEVGVMGGVIMKGRAEGWGMVRWKERNIFLQVPVKLLSLFSVSLEIAFRISSLKIRYPHS